MHPRLIALSFVVASLALSADLGACGDKFLVPGRGARVKPKVDRASAGVLLYARTGSALDATVQKLSIDAKLRAAGYRPTLAASPADLERAVRGREWDVVIVDLADAADVAARLPAASASVVPVVAEVDKGMRDEARRAYHRLITSPKRHQVFVDAIDDAVIERARVRTKRTGSVSE